MGSVSGRSLHPEVGQVLEHDSDAAGVALSGHLHFRLDVGTASGRR